MSKKPSFVRRRPIFTLLVLTCIAAGVWYALRERSESESVSYRELTVTRGDLAVTVLSSGVVQPENRLDIKPPIAGRVEDVLVGEGAEVKKGQLLAWMSSTERAALLDAARARGHEEYKRWSEFYKATPIIAPIDGTIILRNIEPGQTFTSQDAVLVMSDRLIVKAQVDETDIALVKLKQPAHVTLDAYPAEVIPAQVAHVAFDAKTVNNVTTYEIDVLPEKIPAHMRSGMTANISFVVASKKNVLLLPAESVHTRGEKSFVQTPAEGAPAPREQEVTTGLSDGKQVELLSGLSEGARVVVPQTAAAAPRKTNPFMPFAGKKKN